MTATGRLAGLGVGALAARAAYGALRATPPGGPARWTRANHRGEPVTLVEGPALVAGAAAALAVAPRLPGRVRAAGLVAVLGAGTFGLYDDLAGSGDARGFRGHLGALARGDITSGAVKIAGIGGTGLAAAALLRRRPVDAVIGGALVAGAANLANLLDLRPGRALKVALAHAPGLVAQGPAGDLVAAAVGPAAALLGDDLGERSMLGDAGANALGALVGVALLARHSRTGQLAHLAAIAALTAASEQVSFSRVIAATPVLRELDRLGRRPG